MLAMTGFDPDLMTGAYQSNAGKPLLGSLRGGQGDCSILPEE
jgi:hypothetical protein